MAGVRRIGHAVLETPDLDRQVAYYQDIMGLELVARETAAAYLACPGGGFSVVLAPGDTAACRSVGLEIAGEADLATIVAEARRQGIAVAERSDPHPGVARSLLLETPHATHVELHMEIAPAGKRAPGASPIAPKKLGHVAFNVFDVKRAVAFYTDILGFRVSDWMGDFFAFLRCGPDHHTINLLPGKQQKMHHIAFEAADWGAIRTACDHLGPRGYPLIWGPGRHGVGHNIFIYHQNPDGQIVELYAEMDQMSDESLGFFDPRPWHEDNPQRPKVWTPGVAASNQWGIPTPDRFRD